MQWYFFCPKVRKYPKGNRENRVTPQGRWKPSGKDRSIFSGKRLAGTRKCLIYYDRRSKKEERTDWVMHEFRLTDEESQRFKTNQVAFVYFLLSGSVKFQNSSAYFLMIFTKHTVSLLKSEIDVLAF